MTKTRDRGSAGRAANQAEARKRKLAAAAAKQAEARRRARRRRLRTYGIPAAIIAAVATVAVVISVAGGGGGGSASPAGSVRVSGPPLAAPLATGDAVPDFSAPALGGGEVSFADYRESPTVLAVWAAWCPVCQDELPVLARLATEFPSVKLVSVVTSIGGRPGPSPEEYMESEGLSFPVGVDDGEGTLGSALGIQGFPTVYYLQPGGVVLATVEGAAPEARVRELFDSLAG